MQVRPKLTIERTFDASIEEVWELWTTREGIESWWGPEGFSVAVQEMEMRPGGKLVYEMTATGPDEVEYMAQAGMPLTTVQRGMIEQGDPPPRLVYKDIAEFLPRVRPPQVRAGGGGGGQGHDERERQGHELPGEAQRIVQVRAGNDQPSESQEEVRLSIGPPHSWGGAVLPIYGEVSAKPTEGLKRTREGRGLNPSFSLSSSSKVIASMTSATLSSMSRALNRMTH